MSNKYKIRSVDIANGQMVIEFEGCQPFNMWIPHNNNGEFLTGEELDKVIQQHYPWEIIQRSMYARFKNGADIEALVEPYPEYVPTAEDVRAERDELLRLSDWTQGKDIPDVVSSTWESYRQALRDITTQPGFPTTVVWPIKP